MSANAVRRSFFRKSFSRRLTVQRLEERTVPAVLIVSNANDSGSGSLRQAISDANSAAYPGLDDVLFDSAFFATAKTITLTTGQIQITQPVNIKGTLAANCTVSGNFASRIFDTSDAPDGTAMSLSNLTLRDGKVAGKGGAIYADHQDLTITNCVLTNNETTGSSSSGGAIDVYFNGALTIKDSSFTNNRASGSGGAISLFYNSAVTIQRSTMSGNTTAGVGGGLCFAQGGSLIIEESMLSGNVANLDNGARGGGAIFFTGTADQFLISNSTLSGNAAPAGEGGAVCLFDFHNNATFQNSTITGNSAEWGGGGIVANFVYGKITLSSTIVAGNAQTNTPDIITYPVFSIGGNNNLVGVTNTGDFTLSGSGNLTGTKAAPLDAKLGPLANNGGPTMTHALLLGSPAINTGNNVAGLTNDQRGPGYARTFQGAPDIGSVESEGLVVSTNADSGLGSLRQAVMNANALAGPNTVTFDPVFFNVPRTIMLATDEIAINDALTIKGPAALVTIDGNAAGRIFSTVGAPAAAAILFESLTLAHGKSSGNGGALVVGDEAVTLRTCSITNSTSTTRGGAIAVNAGGSVVIEDSNINTNSAAFSGGAICVTQSSSVTIKRSTLSGNTAANSGGAMCFYAGGVLSVADSTLSGNVTNASGSTVGGGGIYFAGATSLFLISNSTLSGNKASTATGGAVCLGNFTGTATFQNSTIAANSGGTKGGGIARTSGSGSIVLSSTIVAGNISSFLTDLSFNASSNVNGNNNLIGVGDAGNFTLTGSGNLTGTTTAPRDAKLAGLANNGGPTKTMALLAGSPCVNAGINPANLTTDQRGTGHARNFNGAPDIGAFELNVMPAAQVNLTPVTTGGGTVAQIQVTYSDPDDGIKVSTIDGADIRVQGPSGFDVMASFVSVDINSNGSPRIATYQFTPPGGYWNFYDNGSYSILLQLGEVTDMEGQAVTGGLLGNLSVNVNVGTRVTNLSDSGFGSLRNAIVEAYDHPGLDTITFDAAVFSSAQTVTLTNGELKVSEALTIVGPGSSLLTINANKLGRVFNTSAAPATTAVTLSALTVTGGNAKVGGAMLIEDEFVTLADCVVSDNYSMGHGGGIALVANGSLTIDRCTLRNNSAYSDGGAIDFANGGSLTIVSSTLDQNLSYTAGGALSFAGTVGTVFTIRNSTLAANTAFGYGGALHMNPFNGVATVRNCTLTGNLATTSGGAVALYAGNGSLTIESTIIGGNGSTDLSPGGFPVILKSSAVSVGGFGYTDAGGNLPFQPVANLKLGSLADNGGPTQTVALLPGSPCIDAGSNPANLLTDQRGAGHARLLGVAVDIGAFEIIAPPTASAGSTSVTTGGPTSQLVQVTYVDSEGILVGTLDSSDIRVQGPGGFDTLAAYSYVDINSNGTPRIATYFFTPPGGNWDSSDNGSYTISLEPGQVTNLIGLSAVAAGIATITVNISSSTLVTNTLDSGPGSLRAALVEANAHAGPDTITFDPVYFATTRTIALTGIEFTIGDAVSIVGPGSSLLMISGAGRRAFNTSSAPAGTAVAISGMKLNSLGASGSGGALMLADESVTLNDCIISGSTSGQRGGAAAVTGAGTLTANNSTFSNNSAALSGGGIYLGSTGTCILNQCTVSGNMAQAAGGIDDRRYLLLNGCAVTGNTANTNRAGGIFVTNANGAAVIKNSTIAGNSTFLDGGGIAVNASQKLTVYNSTIANNFATTNGGGISAGATATITLVSSIIAKNTNATAPDIFTTTVSADYCDLGSALGITTLNITNSLPVGVDPLLDNLNDNGGPTKTMALKANSPCLNVGSNTIGLTTDQRAAGFARLAGSAVDMGAFEFVPPPPPPTVAKVDINQGSAQRSRITSVAVTFDSHVTLPANAASAFQLIRQSDNALPVLSSSVTDSGTGTVVTLTFMETTAVNNSSLADGRYTLTAFANSIANIGGQLDGNKNGAGGDNFVLASAATGNPPTNIFRLFGDNNGDGTVNGSDFLAFRLAFLGSSPTFDFNGDGQVTGTDFLQFRLRFLQTI